MRLIFCTWLVLFWLEVIGTNVHTVVQAAGHRGCCTTFSKIRAVKAIASKGGAVRCRRQNITEGCSVNAVVLMWKRRQVCVNPIPRKMKKLVATLCTRKPCTVKPNASCPRTKTTRKT